MSPEAIARAIDLDDDGVMQQAVEQRDGDDGATEDFAPFGKASVRSEDHRPFFIARIDQLGEQIATTGYDREITDLVDDQQRWPAVEADPLAQRRSNELWFQGRLPPDRRLSFTCRRSRLGSRALDSRSRSASDGYRP